MKRTLNPEQTVIDECKRGLLITELGETSTAYYYVPRSTVVVVTTLGKNTSVKFGKGTLTLTMPDSMWSEYGDKILVAALGEDAV